MNPPRLPSQLERLGDHHLSGNGDSIRDRGDALPCLEPTLLTRFGHIVGTH